jgi:molecular chaperone HscB
MNYFELFSLEPSFEIDSLELQVRFRDLQSRFHPDKFASESEPLKASALQKAALINDAYGTLKDPVRRAEYLVSLHGIELAGEQKTLNDLDFLMRQMELREGLEAIERDQDPEAAIDKMSLTIKQAQRALETEFVQLFLSEQYERAADAARKMKFFARLAQQLRHLEDKLLEI